MVKKQIRDEEFKEQTFNKGIIYCHLLATT